MRIKKNRKRKNKISRKERKKNFFPRKILQMCCFNRKKRFTFWKKEDVVQRILKE